MKKSIACIIAILLAAQSALASGDFRGSYSQYTEPATESVRPPRGFKPFYISHYGRHGSRYLLSEQEFVAIQVLESRADGLKADGAALLEDLRAIRQAHRGMEGMLTDKGAIQHRGIGMRMAKRFRKVFRRRDREIRCISSPAQRCIQSMGNFALGLRDAGAKGHISMRTGEKYYDLVSPRFDGTVWRSAVRARRDSILSSRGIPDSLSCRLFKAGMAPGEKDLLLLCNSIYAMGAAASGLDKDFPDIFEKYLGPAVSSVLEEAEVFYYNTLFRSAGVPDNLWMQKTSYAVLKEVMDKADDALRSGDIAADLRFGHDSGIIPLMTLMGFPEVELKMASNFQIIFYKNRKGKVLVRFLYNENDLVLPDTEAVRGCFYDWEELSSRYLRIISTAWSSERPSTLSTRS